MRTASATLASLVDREILIKTSEQQRGPKVEYGPGPKSPNRQPRRVKGKPGQEPTNRSTADADVDGGQLDLWDDTGREELGGE